MFVALPKTVESQVLGKQLLRSGTSVGAHYREACRARTTAEFISKIEGGLAELDETMYWLELIAESGIVAKPRLSAIHREANELTAILVACVKNAKAKAASANPSRRKQ
jgi:four helix bundle protein